MAVQSDNSGSQPDKASQINSMFYLNIFWKSYAHVRKKQHKPPKNTQTFFNVSWKYSLQKEKIKKKVK